MSEVSHGCDKMPTEGPEGRKVNFGSQIQDTYFMKQSRQQEQEQLSFICVQEAETMLELSSISPLSSSRIPGGKW